ncbi:hypothetical protein ANCCAN_26810, partial [Ancylostoma caninum]
PESNAPPPTKPLAPSAPKQSSSSQPTERKPLAVEKPPAESQSPALAKAAVETKEEKPRPVSGAAPTSTPTSNPYAAAPEAKVLTSTAASPSVPASMRAEGVPADGTAPSYGASERSANIGLTTLVPNPYASTPPLPQMPYCSEDWD